LIEGQLARPPLELSLNPAIVRLPEEGGEGRGKRYPEHTDRCGRKEPASDVH
jgi:hypothetical protein